LLGDCRRHIVVGDIQIRRCVCGYDWVDTGDT
jgi:hypothetical protein